MKLHLWLPETCWRRTRCAFFNPHCLVRCEHRDLVSACVDGARLADDAEIRKLTSANMRQFQPFLARHFRWPRRETVSAVRYSWSLNSLIKHAGLVLFDKSHSDGYDTWEILSRLTLNGAKLEVIPRAMFWTGPAMKGTKYTKDDRAGRFATEKLERR